MRELKFRAFDIKDKKWLYGYDYPGLGGFSIKGECILLGEFGSDMPLERFLNDVEITQFIGLKDKNGKEIYENDIIKISSRGLEYICRIEWPDDLIPLDEFGKQYEHMLYSPFWKTCEVIGNVYENHELL